MKPAGKGARLTEGPISSALYSLMLPMMLGMVAIIINSLAGAFFLARISTDQLAAISFTFPVSFIVGAMAMALGTGTSAVVSRLFGSGDRGEVQRLTLHAMLLAVALAVVMLIIGLATIDPLFRLLGADAITLPHIHRYMAIYYWGGLFLVAPMMANSVLRASGDAKTPALLMTLAAILNVAFDAVLIFGLFGFPRMEIAGAALGGVLANVCIFGASMYFIVHKEKLVKLGAGALDHLKDSWSRILKVGVPSLTSSLMAPVTTAIITAQVAKYGHGAVAGFGLASRVEGLSVLALMSLSAAMTPYTGQNFGARRLDRVEGGVNFAYRFSWIYGGILAVVMWLLGHFLVDLFQVEPAAREAALLHLWIVPMSYAFLGMSMATNGAFNAMGKPMAAMWVSLSRTIGVYAPLSFVLAHFFGLKGIFMAAAVANLVAGSIGFTWFRWEFRRRAAAQAAATAA
jgi:putative MATE family efflux protein